MISDVDPQEAGEIIASCGTIDRDKYIIVRYRLMPQDGMTVEHAAVRIALMTSLRTLKPLPYESHDIRMEQAARVFSCCEDSGEATIGYPVSFCTPNEGLTQLLAMIATGCEYGYTKGFWIDGIEFPHSFLSRFKGPRFGIEGIRERFDVPLRPLIGVVVKPRYGISLKKHSELLRESLLGGADFIVDDVLMVDPEGDMSFKSRVPVLADIARDVSTEIRENKWYVANVSASYAVARQYAKIARAEGVGMLVVNTFTMGLSTIQELANDPEINLPLITTSFGIGLLTHPGVPSTAKVRPNGISEEVFTLLTRLAGTDAAHVGTSGTDCAAKEAWGPAVVALRQPLHHVRRCFSVAEGDLTIASVWDNLFSLGNDFMIETCSGIMDYPSGPARGAHAFREMLGTLNYRMTREEAHDRIMDLARKYKDIREALEYYKYGTE